MKKRILVKVSGGSLKSNNDIFDLQKVENLAKQIFILSKDYQISLVIGGGNIFRGNLAKEFNINRNDADSMGMLATMINGLILQNVFTNNNIKSKLFSALKIDKIIDEYTTRYVNQCLDNDYVCILVAGTGSPFFTTDTGAALRAAETNSNMILMGKNGVDGVYDSDPMKNPNAQRFDFLTYDEIISKSLNVMDQSALTLCWDNNIDLLVFDIKKENSLIKALNKEIKTTLISKG